MENINIASFSEANTATVKGIWQYDFGQILRIEGLGLPDAVEVHFSLQKTGGEAKRRIGVTKDGVTDVRIPDFILEEESSVKYEAYAFIYVSDRIHGNTTKKIIMEIEARPKPEAFNKPCEAEIFQDTIEAVRESMAGAEAAADMQKIVDTAMFYVSYNTTYCNALNMWIKSISKASELEQIQWGTKIPEEFQNEVLKDYVKAMASGGIA